MKVLNHRILLLALTLCCFWQQGKSQSLCLETPPTQTEIEACNANIAHAFAPELHQLTRSFTPNGVFPDAVFLTDIPTAVDYDGNWNGSDNWDNIKDNPINPSMYYAVWWTDSYWLIRYYIYYPRDWANSVPAWCFFDMHEHDLEYVNVLVKRPTTQAEADDPSLLSYGTAISHHGDREYAACPPGSTGPSNISYPRGTHPVVYSSIGSHAMYYTESEADQDGQFTSCKPNSNFIVTYFPSAASPQPVMSCTSTSCYQPYTLINMFNPTAGLWAQRDTEELWEGDLFDCNGLVCKVGKPWLGNGATPVCGFIEQLSALCNPITGESLAPDDTNCDDYIYNGYCDTLTTEFDLNETYCCGSSVGLDGRATSGETSYKIDITEIGGVAKVSTGWVDGTINIVDLSVVWSDGTSGGKLQAGKSYQVCLTPKECDRGDILCKEFSIVQPSFNFTLEDGLGNPLADGASIEPGSRPRLVPTELSCINKYRIKICESPIIEGAFKKNDDCTWYYSDVITHSNSVDLDGAMVTNWLEPDFSFREGYTYKICMYSDGTCTVPICQGLEATGEPNLTCIEESETTFPFCYAVITNCPPETFCDPCFNGGVICVYDQEGEPLDMNDYVFSIDMGNHIIGSNNSCFHFSPQQAAMIKGFYVYYSPWKTSYYVPLDLCKFAIGDDGPGIQATPPAVSREAQQNDSNSNDFSAEVYPNPTSGVVFISIPEMTRGQVVVSNLMGQEVFRGALEDTRKVDLSTWEKGVYLLTILDENARPLRTWKVIRQ